MDTEESYRKLIQISPVGLFRADISGDWIYVNDRICELTGLTYDQAMGRGWVNGLHPDDRVRVETEWDASRRADAPFRLETRFVTPGGTTVWALGKAVAERDDRGELRGHVGAFVDITSRKVYEEQLLKSEARLADAQKTARLGNWEWNIVTNELYWSDEIYRIFGLRRQKCDPTYDDFMSTVHPDDRAAVEEAVKRALDEREHYCIEHRVVHPDGGERLVEEHGEVYSDEAGTPQRMVGTVQDITDSRRAEHWLKLAEAVFDSAIEGVLFTDARNNIISVNKAFTEITGYREDEVVGKTPRILRSDRHDKAFYQAMWKSLMESGAWEGEIWNRRKDGEAYLEWLSISVLKDDYGRVQHYIAVFHDITDVRHSEEQLQHHTYHDALTGLPNRVLFMDRLEIALAHARNHGKKLAVLFLGLDRFGNINETLGPAVGDSLLREVGCRLAEQAIEGDTVSRFAGDEFTFILEELDGESRALGVTGAIMDALRQPFHLEGHEIYVTTSVGLAFYPADASDAETLVKNADIAMMRAKQEGKNNYQCFTPAMNTRSVKRLELERDLRNAIVNEELSVYYQPKLCLHSGRIVGMEALVRWIRGDVVVSPGDFIPIAEETGLVSPLTDWVLRESCRQNRAWQDEGLPFMRVAVNVSALQFRDKKLIETVKNILNETGLDPKGLEIEITESLIMANMGEAIEIMHSLNTMGISLAIDDFGTGYSSLSYLSRFPLDSLKIDKSFVDDVTVSEEAATIARIILSLAKSLDLKVVAEGVETNEQLEFFRSHQCDQIQGYLFSRPLPGPAFTRLLREGMTETQT